MSFRVSQVYEEGSMSVADQSRDQNGRTDPFREMPSVEIMGEDEQEKEVAHSAPQAPQTIVIVERNAFLRDCLQRSVTDFSRGQTIGCASLAELAHVLPDDRSAVVLLSTLSLSEEEKDEELERLAELDPRPQTMVLAKNHGLNSVLFALNHGANGYISMSAGFDIFVQALRFVGSGGTYIPAQCLLEAKKAPAAGAERPSANLFTNREMAVIQAIRHGKPNKVIAYELNMCESTVKVHVRHIMKKLHARNRTDVAIKSADLASSPMRREWAPPA